MIPLGQSADQTWHLTLTFTVLTVNLNHLLALLIFVAQGGQTWSESVEFLSANIPVF